MKKERGSRVWAGIIAMAVGSTATVVWMMDNRGTDPQAIAKSAGNSKEPDSSRIASRPAGPSEELQDALKDLQNFPAGAERHLKLEKLIGSLAQLPKRQALSLIREFLGTNVDTRTGRELKVGRNGKLESWPSLRVAMIDLLGRIDGDAAVAEARRILSEATTADEWAVSLRNYAWHKTGDEATRYLKGKTLELIKNAAWQAHPSSGFFEAFDLLVHTRATDAAPLLADLVLVSQRPDLNYAAFLSMDRLTMTSTADMLRQLALLPQLSTGRPEMVACMFARADVRDHHQRQALETYLASPQRTEIEFEAFAGVYPNANALVSDNLVTPASALGEAQSASINDAAALHWIETISSDARFSSFKPYTPRIHQRLSRFVLEGR